MDQFPLKYNSDDLKRYRHFDDMPQPIDGFLENVLRLVEINGARVLDYGCGLGRMVPQLLSLGASKVVGCDPSKDMINGAKQLLTEGKRGDASAVSFDELTDLPLQYESDSFHGILSRFVLHYIADTSAVLAELHRVIKPGGWFVAVFSDVYFELGFEHLANTDLPLQFTGGASARTLAKPGMEIVDNAKAVGFEIVRYENVLNGSAATIDPSYAYRDKLRLETSLLIARKKK